MEAISSVAIIGTGNVASHLGTALFVQGVRISGVYGRNSSEASALSNNWNTEALSNPGEAIADLVLVCVSDDAISEVVEKISQGSRIAYTSGSFPLSSLSGRDSIGVFYPLQTFTKGRSVDIFQVPFLIEADSEIFAQQLFDLAWKISRKVIFADSENRKFYHLAAVWVNNFTNHLSYQAKEVLDERDLDFSLLLPLLKETVDKLEQMGPFSAQTGPARRGDLQTIRKQEELQEGIRKDLYSLITKSIIETYKK